MVVHRKNLLEAFRHAGSAPAQEPEPPAGPFATSAPAPVEEEVRDSVRPAVPVWVPWAFGVALAFVVGLAVGRSTARVEAGTGDGASTLAGASVPEVRYEGGASRFDPPAAEASRNEREGDAPASLLDPANRYTIIVATYNASRQDFARATMQYLYDEGFDVMPLAEWKGSYLVLVGASPDVDGLRATRDRLTRLPSWDGTPEAFADAYVFEIDRLIER